MTFEAEDIIKQAIDYHGDRIAVACSFGKDSMVVLHMALKYDPEIKVIFENTRVQFLETYRYRDKMVKKWNINLYESKPIKSFWQCVKEYGLPKPRKRGGKGSNAPKCCQYLKEKPGLLLERSLGVNAVITGLQACESQSRTLLAMRYDSGHIPYTERDNIEFCSQRWYTRSTDKWNYHPVMNWSIKDVWKYTKENDIPISEVYTKWNGLYPRSGCLTCTAYTSWEDRLSISHPKLYRHLKKLKSGEDKKASPIPLELKITTEEKINSRQKKLAPFYYETIDKCKRCGKRSTLDHEGYCFWCWEEIQEGLHMLGQDAELQLFLDKRFKGEVKELENGNNIIIRK